MVMSRQNKIQQTDMPHRFKPLSDEELEQMYLNTLIEYQADVALEIGYYKRLLEKPRSEKITYLLKNLIRLKGKEYWRSDIEIDRCGNAQEENSRAA